MLEKEWICSINDDNNGRKKEYVITNQGKQILGQEISRLEELVYNGKRFFR